MHVRTATDPDLDAVLELLSTDVIRERDEPSEVTPRQREAMRHITGDEHTDILVVEDEGRLVATAQVFWLRHLIYDGGLICQLESVRTAPDHRGRGIGAALVEHVVAEARRRGAARVQLTTNRQRDKTVRFYERLGFVASHVGMKRYLGGEA